MISAVSAAFIAAQGKVKYGELAEKFEHLSDTYNLLTADAFFRMTKAQINMNEQLGEETVNKLVKFLEYTQDVEKNAKNGAPLPPNWITKKVERQVARAEFKKTDIPGPNMVGGVERGPHFKSQLQVIDGNFAK